jgi:hypothetical protein
MINNYKNFKNNKMSLFYKLNNQFNKIKQMF